MSLQVWLPLNGNINNYGVSDLVFSNNGATSNTSGKIGSCYYSPDYSSYSLISNKTLMLSNKQSMFCWVKFVNLTSSSSLGGAMVGQHRYPSNTGMGLTFKYVSSTTGYLSINTGTGSGRTYNTYCGSTLLQANIWYHVGYTYDGSTVKLYVNGVLDGTHNVGTLSNPADYVHVFAWSFSGSSGTGIYGGYHLYGYLNDVRIYDNVVSYDEVKEISKALVAHYPLNDAYLEPTTNIDPLRGSTLDFGHMESYERTHYMGRDCWHVIVSDTGAANWSGSYSSLVGFPAGYVGTRSCWVNFPPDQNRSGWYGCPFAFENCDVAVRKNYDFDKMGTWQFCYETATATSSAGSNFLFYWFAIGSGSVRVEFYITDIQFENKDHPTPYTQDSRNELTVYDCSGYRNNGSATSGVQILSESSLKYNRSVFFPNTSQYISVPASFCPSFANSYTFAYYGKISSISGRMAWGFSNGNRLNVYPSTYFCWNTGDGGSNPFRDSSGAGVPYTAYSDNKWHHYAITGDGTTTKLYIDGVYKGAAVIYRALTGTQIYLSGWDTSTDYKWIGSLSDFRIYATTLSAEDILRLYRTSAFIDKNKALHCYELEDDSENIFKTEYLQKYASSLNGGYGQWTTRNSVPAQMLQPHLFYYGSGDERNTSVLKDYFIPNTQYKFDMWLDADDVYYDGVSSNVPGGFTVCYTDGSSDSTFVVTGNRSNPIGFQHRTLITPAGKSIKGISIYYYVSDNVYYKFGSFIAPLSKTSINRNGVFEDSYTTEADNTINITKGGFSYVNSVIEV